MGSSQVKELYKDNKPLEDEFPLSINVDSLLLGDEYVTSFLKTIQKSLKVSDTESTSAETRDKLFPQNNVQKNKSEVDKDFMKARVRQFLSDNYCCGFSNALANIQGLTDQQFSRYFTVETDTKTSEYTLARLDSYRLLYSLFMAKNDKNATEQTFFEYVENFLLESGDKYTSMIAIYSGMVLDLVSSERLIETLKFFLQKLEDTAVRSGDELYPENTGTMFVVDANMNQTRRLLISIVKDSKSNAEILTLAMKIMLRIAITRRNAEDFLIIAKLIDQDPSLATKVDLRAEFKAMPGLLGGQASASSSAQDQAKDAKTTISWKTSFGANTWYLWALAMGDLQQDSDHLSNGNHWTLNSDNIFMISSDGALFKLSRTDGQGMPVLVDQNSDAGLSAGQSIVCYNNKLYVYKNDSDTPLSIFSTDTLQEDTDAQEAIEWVEDEGAITMKQQDEDSKTGRRQKNSIMCTDGEFFYIISTRKYIKPKDADEDAESLPLATVLEKFDPAHNFKHVSSVTLIKNDAGDLWINKALKSSDDYEDEFICKSYIATNGKHLLWRTKEGKVKVFDMKSGIKLKHSDDKDCYPLALQKKEEPAEEGGSESSESEEDSATGLFYDHQSGSWFSIQKDTKHKQNEDDCYQITDFKWDALSKIASASSKSEESGCSNMTEHFKQLYLSGFEQPAPANVIMRIMTGRDKPKDSGKTTSLPKDSADLMKATLLGFVASNCLKFNVRYQEAMQNKSPQDSFIEMFRFPYATYVTSEMFSSLQYFMSRASEMRNQTNTNDTLASQHSFLYILQILAANFKALSFCGIKLPQILDEDQNYKDFLNVYQKTVVQMIEQGYTDPEPQCASVWRSIYEQCQSIIVNSMELLYSDTKEVIFSLEKVFKQRERQTTKQLENSAFSLQYLARKDNMKKLLKAGGEQHQSLNFVLETLSVKLSNHMKEKIQKNLLTQDLPANEPLSLFWRSYHEFQASLAENLLVEFESLNQRIQDNKGTNTDQKAQKVSDEASLQELSYLLCATFKQLSGQFKQTVSTAQESLLNDVHSKESEYFDSDVAAKFKKLQKRVKGLILDQRNTNSLKLYIESIPTICTQHITVCQSAAQDLIDIVQTISDYRKMIRSQIRPLSGKSGEKEDSDEEDPEMNDDFVTNLDKMQRKAAWGIGLISFSYSHIKIDTMTPEQQKDETRNQKMERLIMESKLLQGGIENRKLNIFSEETRDQLKSVLEVSGDYTLHEMIEIPTDDQKGDDEDQRLEAIMTPGMDKNVDNLCMLLQYRMERAQPIVTFARIGGPDGLRVSRATFAVMVKYNEATCNFDNLVDEIEIMKNDVKDLFGTALATKMQEILIDSEMEDELKELDKLWLNANKMRLWIMEKKKNLVQKLEPEQKTKYESNNDIEGGKLTEAQQEELNKLVDAEFEKQIQEIFEKMINKAKMLLHMKVPQDYRSKGSNFEDNMKRKEQIQLIRNPSYVKAEDTTPNLEQSPSNVDFVMNKTNSSLSGSSVQSHNNLTDWRKELLAWQKHQQDSNNEEEEQHQQILKDANSSILAMLQLPITVKKIKQQVETKFLQAAKRVAGLRMLASIISLDLVDGCAIDISNWFCTSLRHKTNELAHYLDQLNGCGSHLEHQLRNQFFEIYKAILEKLKQSKDKQECLSLLDAISWKFGSRDHQMLNSLEVFRTLRFGNGHRKNLIKRAWGRKLQTKIPSLDEPKDDMTAEILSRFEYLFYAVVSRIVDSEGGTSMNFKKGGTSTPGLQKQKSVIDSDVSEQALGVAVDILFRELNRAQQMVADFEGIDHFSYVWQKNKEIKDEDADKMEYNDELLFDEDKEEELYKKKKEGKDDEAKSENEESENDEEENSDGPKKQDPKKAKSDSDEESEGEKDDDEDAGEDAEEDAEENGSDEDDQVDKDAEELTEAEEKARSHLNELTEGEFKLINKLYAQSYMLRLLRMVELFTSAAVHRDYPRQMVKRVANPFMLQTLIKVLLHSTPRSQQICLSVLQNLLEMGIPAQVFQSTVDMIAQGPRGQEVLETANQSAIKFENSNFLRFLFGFALQTRKAMWDSRQMQAEGEYEISQTVFRLLRKITLLDQSYSEWSLELLKVQENALMNFESLSTAELDVIFSLQLGGDFQRMASGTHALTSRDQVVTILGYAQHELTRGIEDEQLEKHHLTSTFSNDKDRMFGLFYDANCEERQEIINLPPHDCTPIEEPNNEKAKLIAQKSIIVTKVSVLKKLVDVLTKQSDKKQASSEEIIVKVHILKCLSNLLKLVPSLMETLSKEGLISKITDFLLETSATKLSTDTVMPTAWLEAKASNIRAQCSSTNSTLDTNYDLQATIVENKQVLFSQTQADGNEVDFNVQLLSGINLYRLGNNAKPKFTVHLDHTNLPVLQAKPVVSNGLVLMDSESLQNLDDHTLEVMQSSQVILTHDIKVQDVFKQMVKKATGQDEDDEKKKQKWKWCLGCIVLVVSQEDFEFVKQPKSVDVPAFYSDANLTPVQQFLRELEEFGGVDTSKIMPFLVELEDQSLQSVQGNIGEILIKIADEEKEYNEKIQQLENDDNIDELKKVKAKRATLLEERQKKVAEKQKSLEQRSQEKTYIEKAIETSKYEEIKGNNQIAGQLECEVFDLIKNTRDSNQEQKIIDPILEKIQQLDQNSSGDDNKVKSDEAMSKQYLRDITGFSSETLQNDYSLVLEQLLVAYAKQVLKDVLHKGNLENLVPALMQNAEKQKRLSCYLKSTYNQATMTKKATGQKHEVKALKVMLRRLFAFCNQQGNSDAKDFMRRFVHEDVLQGAQASANSIWTLKTESVSKHFSTDEIAVQECNPYLLKFVTSLLLENRSAIFTESKTYLPCFFATIMSHIIKFWDNSEMKIVKDLLTSAMQIIFFTREYLEQYCKNDVVSKLVNTRLITTMIKDIDFMSNSKFSEEQKQMMEVYLGLISLKEEAQQKYGLKFDSELEITQGISFVKRGLKVVQDIENMEFLKYHIHKESLKPHQLKIFNQTVNSQHPAFEVKTRSKFSYDQVERMKVTFNAQTTFAPLTFMGISQNQNGDHTQLYTKEDLKKEFNFNRSHFYLFYPVKRQMVVAMGESKFGRLGVDKESEQPQLVMDTQDMAPKKIFAHKFSSMLIDKDDELWSVGERYGSDQHKFTKITIKDEKVKDVFIGHKTRFVLTQSDKVFMQGTSKQFNLPNDQSCNSFKEFTLPDTTDKIIHISCGNHYTCYTTASGKVWATGRQFLKRFGLDSDVPVLIPIPAGLKVVKTYTSSTKEQQMCILEVNDGSQIPKFYSAGKADNGLLGQGGKTRESKTFKQVLIPDGVCLTQVSVFADHALAVCSKGKLYAWGSNLQHRAGLQAELTEGIFQPTNVPFTDGYVPVEVSAGLDHSLVLAREQAGGKTKLFSLGKEEGNFKHLGCTKEQATQNVIHEVAAFADFQVLSFSAATKYNQVVLAGEKEPKDGLYEHTVGNNKVSKGLMHAYQKNGKWIFVGEDELESRKAELPDVCIAFKCPIKDAEKVLSNTKFLPSLDQLKLSAQGSGKTFPQSSVSQKPIEGACYQAVTKIGSDDLSVTLSLPELLDCTSFDLHPLIYFRLTRPLADDCRLPCLDLKNFYRTGSAYGIQYEVEPDLSYQVNDKLIESTKTEYNEFVEALKKFPVKCDKELIQAMNKQMAGVSKDHDKVEPDKDFNVADMKFDKDSKLRKVSDNIKKQRVKLIWTFNQVFVNVYRYLVSEPCKPFKGQRSINSSASNLFNNVKHIILTTVKMKFVDKAIESLPEGSGQDSIRLDRHQAYYFKDSGQIDHTGEYTIFGQTFQHLRSKTPKWDQFKISDVNNMVFSCNFVGEDACDAGGPYRDILSNIAEEIQNSDILPLMIKSINQRQDHGENRECFVVNSESVTPSHEAMFEYLGVWLGHAFRSRSCLALYFAPSVWKLLNDQTLKEDDLKDFDMYAWQELQDLRKNCKELSAQDFDAVTEDVFLTKNSAGKTIALCEDGKNKSVNHTNVEEYISLVLKARFEESSQQIKWIQKGIHQIVPRSILTMLDWEEIECRVVGDKNVDIDIMKKITSCSGGDKSEIMTWFWEIFEEMSNEDRCLYLKFVWGRSRLPNDVVNLGCRHYISIYRNYGDQDNSEYLPIGHTCGFSVDFYQYKSKEQFEKKLLTAIRFCGDIDND